MLLLVLLGVTGCGASGSRSSPTAMSTSPPPASPYATYDEQVQSLLHSSATWSTPRHVGAFLTQRIGLSFGQIAALKPEIDQLVPNAVRTSAGTHEVGPTMSVPLSVDAGDATIDEPVSIDKSTGTTVHSLFTWQIRPVHPSDGMLFTAHVTIPLTDQHVDTYDIPLSLPVGWTLAYTRHAVFTSWATYLSMAGTALAVGGWLWHRRVRFERKLRGLAGGAPRRGTRRGKRRGRPTP